MMTANLAKAKRTTAGVRNSGQKLLGGMAGRTLATDEAAADATNDLMTIHEKGA